MAAHESLLDVVDDRMAMAISLVNQSRRRVDFPRLSAYARAELASPRRYRPFLALMAKNLRIDLSEAIALLDEWHAWHGA